MANMKQHKLGWIGIGRMGYAMAERLAKAGCDISVWNRTRAAEVLEISHRALLYKIKEYGIDPDAEAELSEG